MELSGTGGYCQLSVVKTMLFSSRLDSWSDLQVFPQYNWNLCRTLLPTDESTSLLFLTPFTDSLSFAELIETGPSRYWNVPYCWPGPLQMETEHYLGRLLIPLSAMTFCIDLFYLISFFSVLLILLFAILVLFFNGFTCFHLFIWI